MNIVIFTGGESPSVDDARLFFKLNSADYIIAADSGLDSFERYFDAGLVNRKPDFLTGDFDSIENRYLVDVKYSDCEKKIYSHDKDWTDSELALMKARKIAGDGDRIVLVGGNGGRPDHFVALLDSFSREYHCDVWLCGQQVIYFVSQGSSVHIKNVCIDDRISVSRITSEYENTCMKCEGLEWSELFPKGMASLSNRISKEYFDQKKKVNLYAEKGSFLVYVPYTAQVSYSK